MPPAIHHRITALVRLIAAFSRHLRVYPPHSPEFARLLAAREYWRTYLTALRWACRQPQ